MDYEVMMNGNVKIGQMAPDFEAITTMGNIKLSDYRGKWLVFFSHPRRFYPGMVYTVGTSLKMLDIYGKFAVLFKSKFYGFNLYKIENRNQSKG